MEVTNAILILINNSTVVISCVFLKILTNARVRKHLGPGLLSLLLVDELHEDALVLEHVTLGLKVQLVVQVAVDLLCLTISSKQATQNPHAPHPELLLRHTSVPCTFALSHASVTSLPSSLVVLTDTVPGVDGDGLLDDETILDEFPDVLSGIGVGDLIDLVGIQPDFVFARCS